ncbi:MAG TPA: YdcF family protein [Bacteroidia bacterium]|jgi:vancomycin permeability regulator SanA|nr:YdcF family protein [Bacteroidia bacterium]
MNRTFKYTSFLLLSWFLIHCAWMSEEGMHDKLAKADCILILGNKVNEDGTLSARLKARLDKGLELFRQHYAHLIMVSGGLGKERFYEGTEMSKYLVSQGVDARAILVDNKGDNTFASAENYALLQTQTGLHSVIIVSQFFHITRTMYMLHKEGVNTVYHAHATYYEWLDLYSVVREFFAFYKFQLTGR